MLIQVLTATYAFPEARWKTVSALAKDLINKLLVVNVQERLSAAGNHHIMPPRMPHRIC